jgi:hypothetical protein
MRPSTSTPPSLRKLRSEKTGSCIPQSPSNAAASVLLAECDDDAHKDEDRAQLRTRFDSNPNTHPYLYTQNTLGWTLG